VKELYNKKFMILSKKIKTITFKWLLKMMHYKTVL
jgi:hypothetical protein